MLAWLEQFLVRYPELALFLVISAGYWIGSFKIGAFSLGPVTGALFAGLLVGQFAHVPVSGMTKSFLFLLFLFGIGYSVGPQFMQSLKRDGLKPVLLAVVVSATGLAASILIAKMLGLDPGFAAGLMSGALTQSAAMGTATDAINGLSLPEAERTRLIAHVAVADAVCYIFGYAGVITVSAQPIAPALLKIDLKTEASKLEEALGMTRDKAGLASAWRKFELRAYRLPEGAPLVGSTVAAAEARAAEHRLFIHRLRRGERIVEAEPGMMLQAGDVIAISGPRQIIVDLVGSRAEEIEDKELLDVPVSAAEVILMNPKIAGRTLAEASRAGLDAWPVSSIAHPRRPGNPDRAERRAAAWRLAACGRAGAGRADMRRRRIGALVAPVSTIDFVVLGLAHFPRRCRWRPLTFRSAGVKISLSTSVGTLLAGLLVGHLRTRYPLFGRIPDGAIALMTSLGLAAFVGLTGIHAGPIFLSALREAGIGLLLGGMVVTLAAADRRTCPSAISCCG